MSEVEVAFKVKQKRTKCETLLKLAGYNLMFRAKTHDVYFTNKELNSSMSEQELKFACVRIRCSNGGYSVDNYNLFDNNYKDKFRCSKQEAKEIVKKLIAAGYSKVFDTAKTDFIYRKNNSYHQLQTIKKIGLLDYFYDEDIANLPEQEQFDLLTSRMISKGFELEYPEGVDKLRSLYAGKLCFSKNQNGNYNLMDKK